MSGKFPEPPPLWWFSICGTWSRERLADLLATADKFGIDRDDRAAMQALWQELNG